jgi:Ca2+-transporting ATPase
MIMDKRFYGLTDNEVLQNREKYGSNVLTPPSREPLWRKFLCKFHDPLIVILMVAGVMSIGISFYEYFGLEESVRVFFEPLGIFIAIFLATGLAFIFEVKADREFSILNQVNDEEPVEVIRNGKHKRIKKCDIVYGDIVSLNTGDEIPADAELLKSVSLIVDESTLTGELSCKKSADKEDDDPNATFPTNHVMRGTKVIEGHALCQVFAVGDKTENGKVFISAQIDNNVKTPLSEQLSRLGSLITKASYIIAALIIVGRMIMYFHFNTFDFVSFIAYLLNTVMIAVTLIVVSVPEGLPMAVTLSLAYSMRRMLKTNNLVRRLHACETMGATTVICTDKTGTLTQNQMTVAEPVFYISDEKLINESIAVNTTAQLDTSDSDQVSVLGNPTDGALLLWLHSRGVDYEELRNNVEVLAEEPFSTDTKYMSTTVMSAVINKKIKFIKGAPEIVYDLCTTSADGKGCDEIKHQLKAFQQKAMRTLGFAYQIEDGETIFYGIVAISDPVREDVPAAVHECMEAGIDIKIVTGDTTDTACEIGRQIGLFTKDEMNDISRYVITGPEFAALSDEELLQRVESLKIISRARPMDKKRLVEALQQRNQVVAVTGDGTNDAPALKSAHVGLSMGSGTSVAKEASDITIIDNSFSSITRAVMWGRSLYKNIQRFILFQMTVNVVACVVVLVGAFTGTQSPLTVTQMLWVNLIMDTFAAMALSSLPPDASVMKEKPRKRSAFIITPQMTWNIIGVGSILAIVLLVLMVILDNSNVNTFMGLFSDFTFVKGKHNMEVGEISLFFTVFVMLQFWNMFNARAFMTRNSALNIRGCRGFTFIAFVILFGQILIVQFGGDMFNVRPIPFMEWIEIIAATSVVLIIGELIRLARRICAR